ncbi:hypothetical protein CL619_04560 [archaeon]|nr:hypothetical protein [archaeon]|tara:strand:- start:36 stop:1022 length:987 start_codon:yes stop_codon:yes gene_type:complete
MTIKLDNKDKKLLYYLSQNCRMSDTKLSKLIKLSKNAIKYRKQRLQEQGIIKHYTATVNLGSIGHHTFCLLLRFNDNIESHEKIKEYFKDHPHVDWAITLSGQWDIFAEFIAKDLNHFHRLIKGVLKHLSSSLNKYQTFFSEDTLRVDHLPAAIYNNLELEQIPQLKRVRKIHNINKTDKKILAYMTKHSNKTFVEVARDLNLTFEIVRYRLKLLEEQATVIKYFPEIDLQRIGFTEYLFSISLKNIDQKIMEKLRRHLRHNPYITYAFVDIASFQILFMTAFEDNKSVDNFSRNLRKEYGTIIQEQDYHLVQEQLKFNLFPEGLVEK